MCNQLLYKTHALIVVTPALMTPMEPATHGTAFPALSIQALHNLAPQAVKSRSPAPSTFTTS